MQQLVRGRVVEFRGIAFSCLLIVVKTVAANNSWVCACFCQGATHLTIRVEQLRCIQCLPVTSKQQLPTVGALNVSVGLL